MIAEYDRTLSELAAVFELAGTPNNPQWLGQNISATEIKLLDDKNLKSLTFHIPKGVGVASHHHPFTEEFKVISGKLELSRQEIWSPTPPVWIKETLDENSSSLVIPPFYPHKAFAVEPTVLKCTFLPGINIQWVQSP